MGSQASASIFAQAEEGEVGSAEPPQFEDRAPDPAEPPPEGHATGALPEGCFWRVERAENYALIVDASEYFAALRRAMLDAEHSILLIGWDFDARIRFVGGKGPPDDDGPECLGDFILWLAKRRPKLQIRLLRWATGALAAMFRGNTLLTVLRWKAHPQITLRLDGRHPFAGSHHQKIVSIDDRMAFCGGIDTTINRWDTREHLDDDPRRKGPGGKSHAPWHDVSCAFDGAAARGIADLARARWRVATGVTLPPCPDLAPIWPKGLQSDLQGVTIGIARSLPKYGDEDAVVEVERTALALIAAAQHSIYCENQYFASRRIAHAIAERLIEPDGPEIVVVCPASAEGWLEPLAMNTARARLMEALKRLDTDRRLRLYHPVTKGRAEIYVHAKVMVVDDRYLRVGSSNFNNRSMRLDSECDVVVLAAEGGKNSSFSGDYLRAEAMELGDLAPSGHLGSDPAQPGGVAPITRLRDELLAEHLGIAPERLSQEIHTQGSLIGAIEALNGPERGLVPYTIPELTGIEEWIADNEILDPDGPDEMFEVSNRRGLFRGWRGLLRKRMELRRARRKASGGGRVAKLRKILGKRRSGP